MIPPPPSFTLFPYTTLFRSDRGPNCSAPAVSAAGPRDKTFRLGATEIGRDTSELQSRVDLVCRLLLEKKNADRDPLLAQEEQHVGHPSHQAHAQVPANDQRR